MNSFLKPDERLDDLELDNLMIIQKQSGYKFSTDSVLLANFIKVKPSDKYVDLCSGSGIVAIIASYKNKVKKSYAVEFQSEVAERSKRSIEYNKLNIEVINNDLSNVPNVLGYESVDVISVNPPYNPVGETSEIDEIALATHEIATNLEKVVIASAKLLKFGGKLFMVHRADRLVDIIYELRKNKLEPKVVKIVYPKKDREPNLVLIEAKKGAKAGVKLPSPLIINNDDGTPTEELKAIYNKRLK